MLNITRNNARYLKERKSHVFIFMSRRESKVKEIFFTVNKKQSSSKYLHPAFDAKNIH